MGFLEWLKSDTDDNASILLDPMGTGVGQGTKNPMDNSKDDSDSKKDENSGKSDKKDTRAEDAKIEKQVQSVNEKMMKNQPLTPYVTISIMGKSITSYTDKTSDCLVGISVTKMGSQKKGFASSKVQIQLYDDKALEIEEIVSNALAKNTKPSKSTNNKKNNDKSDSSDSKKDDSKKDSKDKKNKSAASNFTLQYGWMARGGGILAETPLMKGNITNYTISFAGSSIELNVEGTISGLYQASKVKTEEYKADVYGGKPSVIVQKIAKDEGWQVGGITETAPMIGEDGKPRSFVRKNQSATQFIVKELSEKATSTSGVVGYTFYFDTGGKMWFVPGTDSNEAQVVDSRGNNYGSILFGTPPIIGGAGSTDWTRSDGSTYSTGTSDGISYPEYRASASSTIKAGGSNSYKAETTSTSTTSGTGDLYIIGGTHIHKIDDAVQQNSHVKMYYNDVADVSYIQSVIDSLPKDMSSGSRICILLDYDSDGIEGYTTAIKSWLREIPSNCYLVFITYPPIYDSKNTDSTISSDLISKYNDTIVGELPGSVEVVDIFKQLKDRVTSYTTDGTGRYYTTQVYQDFYNMIISSTYVSYVGSGHSQHKSAKKDYSGVEDLLKMGVSMSSLNGTVYQSIINDVLDDTIGSSSNSTDKTRKLITDVLTTVLTTSKSTGTPASTTTIQDLLNMRGIILHDTMNDSIVQRIQSLSTDATVLNMVPNSSIKSLLGTSNLLGTSVSDYIMNNSILNYEQKDSSTATEGSDDKNASVAEDPMGIGMGTDSGSKSDSSSDNKSDSGSGTDGKDKTPAKKAHSVIGYYEYYTGRPDGVVISFSPEFKGNAIAGSKKAGKNLSVDTVRNEMLKCTVGGKGASESDTGDDGSEYLVMGMSSSTYSDLEKASVSLWNRYHSSAVKASLEVLGNPFLEVGKYIKLAVFTKYGFMHHTSGEYLIKSIEDSIAGGSYTSSLQLVKNEKNASKGKKGEGASRTPGSVSVPDGTYWQPQNPGINFDDAKPWMVDIANYLGEWFFSQTGHKLVITSVTTGDKHNAGQYSHYNGYKLDCGDWGGTEDPLSGGKLVTDDSGVVDESFQSSFLDYGREAGLGMSIEGSDDSNYHIDVQSMGYEWTTGADNGGWPDAKSQEGDS